MLYRAVHSSLVITALSIVLSLQPFSTDAAYREGEVLVKYKAGASVRAKSAVASIGAQVAQTIDGIGIHRLKLPPGLSVQSAIERLKKNPNIEYVGPNHLVSICTQPNDNYFRDAYLHYWQWGLYSSDWPDAGIHAPSAWDIQTGDSDIIIAFVDTGVWSTHEDLQAKLVPGRNTIDGADPNNTEDDNSHGTYTAGIAAASTNNTIGIAGVSWGARIMPIKALNASGWGTEAAVADGIEWAADHGAKIISMSMGGYDDVEVERLAVDYAWGKGCVLVGASGNNNCGVPFYPASYDNVLAVGATNQSAQRCTPDDWPPDLGSNFGDYLDVMAPGNSIFSTSFNSSPLGPYKIAYGTSAAAPFVSGIAALLVSEFENWTNADVVDQIKATCRDLEEPGWDYYTGWGLVDAYNALSDPPFTIGELSSLQNGTIVTVRNVVITSGKGDLGDRFYVEQVDRACGVMLPFVDPPSGFSEGDMVDIDGTVTTVGGELAIQGATLTNKSTHGPLKPFALNNCRVGGGQLNLKQGVTGGIGINNIGLFIAVYGRVTAVGWTYFYIDDGSANQDGSGMDGLKIICGSLAKPAQNNFVRVKGISSVEQPPGAGVTIPVVRARRQSDIITF